MTLNTMKPRSAIRCLSPSMVCATDLLLGLVMTPSEDRVLSGIRLPSEVGAVVPAARTGRCLILVQNASLRGERRRLDTRPDHRRYAHTARHRQSSGELHQH